MEPNGYLVLYKGAVGEITEKKSRFIATLSPVKDEAEATAFIDEMKKKYWDARHNCTAFVIGKNAELTRCSDDGEPSGTAGRPMLEILMGSGIRNVVVVVTRYFGGILLGTGGLVKAYSQAVKEALSLCQVARVVKGYFVDVTMDFTDAGKIQYYLNAENIKTLETEYTDKVKFKLFLEVSKKDAVLTAITDKTGGRAVFGELIEGEDSILI